MLIFDQLKKDDPQLRFLAVIVLGGFIILLTGLWWVQLVSTSYFQKTLDNQSIRSVRIPAVRGKILDRNGHPLADSRPVYSIDLYLDTLSKSYQKAYNAAAGRLQTNFDLQIAAKQRRLGHKLTPDEKKGLVMTESLRNQLHQQTRYEVTSNLLADLSARLREPISLTQSNFEKWYDRSRVLPLPVMPNLTPRQVASFEEQSTSIPGVDLEVQSLRFYPSGAAGAHLIGFLTHDDESKDDKNYSYRLANYAGAAGLEKFFDDELQGTPGEKSVVINNYGFRQPNLETVESPPTPGANVILTIDLDVQKVADAALLGKTGPEQHGAVIVMDVRNGDILALASTPTYNPNHFIQHPDPLLWEKEWSHWTNADLQEQMNHAVQGLYPPGSIFKIVVGLAGLELGTLNPKEILTSPGYYPMPGRSPILDTAPAGDYDFDTALALSCNFYFITQGLKPGVLPKEVALGQRLHFGERTGLFPGFEGRGYFPKLSDTKAASWHNGNTANMSIGQDRLAVTPLQIAVMISAIANGGTVFKPRIVSRIESYNGDEIIQAFPDHQVRDNLGVSARSLATVAEAMRADVERPKHQSTGYLAAVPGMVIAGKSGTAQVEKKGHIDKSLQITWFGSFASMGTNESPRYAVVAMISGGASGGTTCAPIAHDVYVALQQMERKAAIKPAALAQAR